MSLFGKLSKLWKGLSTRRTYDRARRRRLFMESLEGRQLMASDLFVTKAITSNPLPRAGENLIYEITVRNAGPDQATAVTFQDFVPDNTTFVSFDQTGGNTFTETQTPPADGTGTGLIERTGVIDLDETITFTLTVHVNSNTPDDTPITNTAIATDPDETDASNNTAEVSFNVQSESDLNIQITNDTPDPVQAGSQLTYTILVTNAGPSDVLSSSLLNFTPDVNTSLVSLTGPTGWNPNGPTGLMTTDPIPANAFLTFTAVVTVDLDADDQSELVAGATISGNPLDTNPANNTVNPSSPGARTRVIGTPRPDVVASKVVTSGATSVVAGTELSYTITVTNQGGAPATNITLRDDLPAFTEYVSFSVPNTNWTLQQEPVGGAGTVVANNPTGLAAGASAVFTFVVRVNASATGNILNRAMLDDVTGETNTGNNDSQEVPTLIRREAALTITKTDTPAATSSRPGDPIRYTVTVANPSVGGGPSDLTGVTIRDLFDTTKLTNIRYTSVALGGASGNDQNANPPTPIDRIEDTNINLPIGSSITYTIDADILSSATGDLSNLASIIVPAGTTNIGTVSDDDVNTLVAEADLLVTKSTVSTFVQPGDLLTYTITVQNVGASDAVNPTLTDMVPAGTTFESFSAPAEWTATTQLPNVGESGTIVFGAGVLAADATASFTLVVRVNPGTVGTTITNTAIGGSDTAEPSQDDNPNTDTVDTPVTGPPAPDLIVTKTDSPDPVIAGQTGQGTTTGFLTYTIRVTNQGTGAANQVVLTDVMPTASSGTQPTFVSFTAPTGWTINTVPTVGAATGTVQVTSNNNATDNLDPMEFAEFTFVVRVPPTATSGATITNTATVAVAAGSLTQETNTANNSSGPTTTTIGTSANLSINKTALTTSPVVVGSLISYTITVSSVGPSNASSVNITDLIPAGTTFQSMTANTGTTGWTIEPPNAIHPNSVIASIPTLTPGATGSFTLTVRTNSNLNDGFVVTNFATIGSTITTDPVPGNNTSPTVSTTVRVPLDFGDAPNSYGTLLASNGPRHAQSLTSTLRLGLSVDNELDGQPNPAGLGDDQNGTSVDDEDGVILPTSLIVGRGGAAIVNVVGEGFLNAWIDFNGDGDFLDDGEQVAFDQAVFDGPNPVAFAVPAGAPTGGTFARFRLNSIGSLAPTGLAADGEVEDYGVTIITVTPGTTEILPDPENPGFNMLSINGTPKGDTVAVNQLRNHLLQVQVTFNGKLSPKYSMADFRRVVFYGGAGNDTFKMGLARPTSLHGEAGNDRLTGGGGYDEIFGGPDNDTLSGANGNDVLVGGTGVDSLSGGGGRDILIGGLGGDTLNGGADDDILIGGTTDYDTNHAALSAIIAEWGASDTFANRTSKLSTLINNGIDDDFAKDKMTGGSGSDWHLNYLLDTISGFSTKADKKRL